MALTVPFWAGSGPTSAAAHSSSTAALLSRLQRLCPVVFRRVRSLGRFFSYCTPQIYWGSSNSMTSFLICMRTTRRSAASLLRRMSCSCRSGFRDAWMTSRNGCSLIVFNLTQPRRKCSGAHPFDVSIKFRSPVCVSASTSLFRLLLSRDLGIYLDCDVSVRTHVSKVVSSCFAVLRRLRSIRSSVTRPVFVSLVVSLVLSRLDYGNATLAGITDRLTDRLRSVLNAAARLIYASRRTEHVTPLLHDLHWLRYPERTEYKLAVLVYRCLHGLAPSYLADEFVRVSEIESRRNLRSASTANLVVPRFQRKTLGGRAFPVAAAQTWNSLPSKVTSSSSLTSFKRNLSCSWDRTFKLDIG